MYVLRDDNCTYISISRYMYIFLYLDYRYILYIIAQHLIVYNIDFVSSNSLFII